MVWIVNRQGVEERGLNYVNAEMIGQKAMGLCCMPDAWTPPFFVVSKDMFNDIIASFDKKQTLKPYISNIISLIDKLNLGTEYIIRSSGVKEGMTERGELESIEVNINNIEEKILELISSLEDNKEIKEEGLPFVIQKYINWELRGHISNERRFQKESRDFVYEYEMKDYRGEQSGSIHLRNWREKPDLGLYIHNKLNGEGDLKSRLKIVCAFYYEKKERVHLEFVYKNHTLYIVQCDKEGDKENAVNPNEYDVKVNGEINFTPKALRKMCDEDRKYKKINNVFIYKDLGEKMPPFYILDDYNIISELKKGIIADSLHDDLEWLTKQSLVIRTNIVEKIHENTQMSKRSDELRSCKKAEDFLIDAVKNLESDGYTDFAFILHTYVPAKIAAFVNAKPMERNVEIQTLWGLPEGLYYNSHDRITVNTISIDLEKMNKNKFKVKKFPAYKEKFVSPDQDGNWVIKEIKPPYDWRDTITDDEIIKDIAYRARKIAEKVEKELSIMWFIGIDEQYYGTSNIPWYHEEYDREKMYYTNKNGVNPIYKKKYFYENELVIKEENDLTILEKQGDYTVRIVRIQPKDGELLRNKDFVKKIGQLCVERRISILLEGAILAHPFYQLIKTGAIVLNGKEIRQFDDIVEYNKLVRDLIPKNIIENGEIVECAKVTSHLYAQQLKNKIIEESIEVTEATGDSVIEELADLLEVSEALEKNLELLQPNCRHLRKMKNADLNFSFDIVSWDYKQYIDVYLANHHVCASAERKGITLQVDLLIGGEKPNKRYQHIPENDQMRIKRELLIAAANLLYADEYRTHLQYIQVIKKKIGEICKILDVSEERLAYVKAMKAERKGKFEEGYVLLKSLSDTPQTNQTDFFDCVPKQSPREIKSFPYKEKIYIDKVNKQRLLIRLTFPIYADDRDWILRNSKLNLFFNKKTEMSIRRRRVKEKIHFDIALSYNNDEQISM